MNIKAFQSVIIAFLAFSFLSLSACKKDDDDNMNCPPKIDFGEIGIDENLQTMDRYEGVKKLTFVNSIRDSLFATFELANENDIVKRIFVTDRTVGCGTSSDSTLMSYSVASREYRFESEEFGTLIIEFYPFVTTGLSNNYDAEEGPQYFGNVSVSYLAPNPANSLVYQNQENVTLSSNTRSEFVALFQDGLNLGDKNFDNYLSLKNIFGSADTQLLYFNETYGLLNYYDDLGLAWVIHSLE